jgi:uncharacterized protein YkwD
MPARRSRGYRGDRRRSGTRVLGVTVICAAVLTVGYLATMAAAHILGATGIATASSSGCRSATSPASSACPQAAAVTVPGQPPVSPAARASTMARRTPSPAADRATAPAITRPASAALGQQAVRQVLKLIDSARAQAGLPRYTLTAGLRRSSRRHDNLMAHGCGLSHQCPGEPSLGARETAAGVPWTTAGENIGEGGPVADTIAAIARMAVGLTQAMLNEKPPDDGHRKNILSSSFTHIGIAVYRDSSGTVWLTQDFSN